MYEGQVGDQTAFDCMKAAYDAGINFFDCAEGYAGGKPKTGMEEAIRKFGWTRNDIVISFKVYWGEALAKTQSIMELYQESISSKVRREP